MKLPWWPNLSNLLRIKGAPAKTVTGRRRGLVDTSTARGPATANGRSLLLVTGSVFLDEILLLFWDIFQRMDRVGGAGGNACATINAAFGIDIHLGRGLEAGLVLLGMNAIGRANLNTEGVFNARISDYVGHDEISLLE
jgi:hypothetical protein